MSSSRTKLTPIACPVVVGNFTAYQDVSSISGAIRCALDSTATSGSGVALFSCDDATIIAGSVAGTFSPTNPATWPLAGLGVRLLGSSAIVGGTNKLGSSPLTFLDVSDPTLWGPGLIILRTAGTAAVNLNVSGLGSGVTPARVTYLEIGAPGAVVSPSGDVRVSRAAQAVLSSVAADNVTANPLLSLDGTDAVILAPIGAIRIGDDSTDRVINIGSGAGASPINLVSGTSATSAWNVAAGGTLNIGSGAAITLTLGGGAGAKTVNLGSGNAVNTINVGTGAAANVITIGTVTGAASLSLKAGSGGGAFVSSGGLSLTPHGAHAGNTTELRFLELVAGGSNYTGFKAPDALAGNVVYVLPTADGTAGQQLTTNGAGVLSWT